MNIMSGALLQVKKEDFISKDDFARVVKESEDKVNQLNAISLELNQMKT
jgi:hypothetical protein